jgi:hypothetical protein
MKRIIFKTTAIVLILAGVIACKKEREEIRLLELDLGMYVETDPTPERTQINLIDREKLAIIKSGWTFIDEYYYAINTEKDSIYLTMIADSSVGGGRESEFYFKIINSSEFEIEYLYTYIWTKPPNMTFEKENMLNN